MLYVKTKLSKEDEKRFIDDVEVYFRYFLMDDIEPNDLVNKILLEIDGATNLKGRYIDSRFGGTCTENLSSGCKALLIAVYNQDKIVNFTEAGINVVKLAVELSQTMDLHIYTQNIITFAKHRDVIINLDGKEMTCIEWVLHYEGGKFKCYT